MNDLTFYPSRGLIFYPKSIDQKALTTSKANSEHNKQSQINKGVINNIKKLIFGYLELPDLLNASKVCKLWNNLIFDTQDFIPATIINARYPWIPKEPLIDLISTLKEKKTRSTSNSVEERCKSIVKNAYKLKKEYIRKPQEISMLENEEDSDLDNPPTVKFICEKDLSKPISRWMKTNFDYFGFEKVAQVKQEIHELHRHLDLAIQNEKNELSTIKELFKLLVQYVPCKQLLMNLDEKIQKECQELIDNKQAKSIPIRYFDLSYPIDKKPYYQDLIDKKYWSALQLAMNAGIDVNILSWNKKGKMGRYEYVQYTISQYHIDSTLKLLSLGWYWPDREPKVKKQYREQFVADLISGLTKIEEAEWEFFKEVLIFCLSIEPQQSLMDLLKNYNEKEKEEILICAYKELTDLWFLKGCYVQRKKNFEEKIQLFLNQKIDLHKQDEKLESPLLFSIFRNRAKDCTLGMVKVFLQNKVNLNFQCPKNGYSFIHHLVNHRDIESLKLILDTRNDIDLAFRSHEGDTPIMLAKKNLEMKESSYYKNDENLEPDYHEIIKILESYEIKHKKSNTDGLELEEFLKMFDIPNYTSLSDNTKSLKRKREEDK